ncbi:RNA-binding domain-containing protein [Cystobasidium minutum MCA 4210]|uniref:RNA-binding domain-containing protein n=1 Tax=Cystobasidium minutum MCA 4210 TaxID=1397322 RepID=UPI0034CF6538|eukprot:jgi/Rhomi1/172714/fgenesh1_kg.5_\
MSFAPPNRRLYVGRISQDASRADLEDLFGSFGAKPTDVKVLSGFGFVEYDSIADAEDAIKELDGRDFMGDRLLVQFAKSSGERPPRRDFDDRRGGFDRGYDRGGYDSRDRYPPPRGGGREKPAQGWRCIISNLPQGVSWQDLKDFARTAGNVHYAEVSRSDPSEGVIEYMSFSDADSAIKTLDGVEMRGSVVRVKEGQAAPGQSWENPRASPPRRDNGRDDRDSYRRRDGSRSRSPGYRRGGDRDRDDRDSRRGGRDDYDDRRGSSRRERSRSPARESRRSPRYDRE